MIRILQLLLRLRLQRRMEMGRFYCLVPGPWPGCSGQRSERQTPRFSAGGWSAFAADHIYHLLDCLQRRVASPRAPHALPGVSFSPLRLHLPHYDYHIDLTFHEYNQNSAAMSSLADAAMRSDIGLEDARSDATAGRRRQARSSSRPRGPPSVSTPGMHSDIEGFPDDEIVGRRGTRRQAPGGTQDVPRVVDTTAEALGIQFERFLDKYVKQA